MRTRDRAHLLERAIASVLAQDWTDWHLIIVNNGDEASVAAAVQCHSVGLAGRYQLVTVNNGIAKTNLGQLTNAGIHASQSRWITQLDDDDSWEPTFLSRATARLDAQRTHEDVKAVATQSLMITEDIVSTIIHEQSRKVMNPGFRRVELFKLANANLFACNAFVYERSALTQVGMYDETLPVLDDWEFNLRFACQFDIDVIDEPLAHYRRRAPTKLADSNNNTASVDHNFWHNKIVNDRLRADFRTGQLGVGWMMAMSVRLQSMTNKMKSFARAGQSSDAHE